MSTFSQKTRKKVHYLPKSTLKSPPFFKESTLKCPLSPEKHPPKSRPGYGPDKIHSTFPCPRSILKFLPVCEYILFIIFSFHVNPAKNWNFASFFSQANTYQVAFASNGNSTYAVFIYGILTDYDGPECFITVSTFY